MLTLYKHLYLIHQSHIIFKQIVHIEKKSSNSIFFKV